MGGNWFCWIVETHSAPGNVQCLRRNVASDSSQLPCGARNPCWRWNRGPPHITPVYRALKLFSRWRVFVNQKCLVSDQQVPKFPPGPARCIKMPWAISHSTLTWFHARIHDSHRMVRALKFHYWMIASPENCTETATYRIYVYIIMYIYIYGFIDAFHFLKAIFTFQHVSAIRFPFSGDYSVHSNFSVTTDNSGGWSRRQNCWENPVKFWLV